MFDGLMNRKVGEVLNDLAEMNAAVAQISGRKADDTPVYSIIFVRGEPTTADVLALLEAYEDEDTPRMNELDAAVNAAAEAVADATGGGERELRVEELGFAVEERRRFHEERERRKALELVRAEEARLDAGELTEDDFFEPEV